MPSALHKVISAKIPLHEAARKREVSTVKTLLNWKNHLGNEMLHANVLLQNSNGLTPLEIANSSQRRYNDKMLFMGIILILQRETAYQEKKISSLETILIGTLESKDIPDCLTRLIVEFVLNTKNSSHKAEISYQQDILSGKYYTFQQMVEMGGQFTANDRANNSTSAIQLATRARRAQSTEKRVSFFKYFQKKHNNH
ncbi:MAG: hypothetical protein HRT90_04645 [Candidatus Margulisbacteria bacterium]|nr:hypothetical protein [Candidatus Margulisiibacteriota bacterium]